MVCAADDVAATIEVGRRVCQCFRQKTTSCRSMTAYTTLATDTPVDTINNATTTSGSSSTDTRASRRDGKGAMGEQEVQKLEERDRWEGDLKPNLSTRDATTRAQCRPSQCASIRYREIQRCSIMSDGSAEFQTVYRAALYATRSFL